MIVVGIDEREQARDALRLAHVLARVTDDRLLLAWAHPYGRLPNIVSGGDDARAARAAVESMVASVRDSLPREHRSELRAVSARSPASGLHGLAEREGASLVVLGPSRRAGIGRVLPGGTALRLLSGSPAPVGVAPAGYRERPGRLETIAVGYDGGAESTTALAWAASLARRAEATLRLLAVHHPPAFPDVSASGAFPVESVNRSLRRALREDARQAVEQLGDGLDVVTSVLDGQPATLLAEQSGEHDLLVLGSRGYGPLRAVLLGSVSSAVLTEASCPVVVTPRAARRSATDNG